MSQSTDKTFFPGPHFPASRESLGGAKGTQIAAIVLGLLGSGAAALFVGVHWSIAAVGGAVLLAFSAIGSETFLLFVIFMMPFGWMLPATVPIRNTYVVVHGLIVVGFFVGRLLRGEVGTERLFHFALSRASLLFCCAAVASTILAQGGMTHESWRADLDLSVYVGFYFLIVAWVDSRQRLNKVLWMLLISTIVTCAFALYQELIGGFTSFWLYLYPPDDYFTVWEGRAASFLSSANALAGYLNLIFPFALACWVLGRGKWKRVGGYTALLGALALFCTQSIGGLLAFFAVLVLAIVCFFRNRKKQLAYFAGLCALLCVFYLLRSVLNPNHTEDVVGSDTATRLMLWVSAWNLFMRFPVIGVGWGNFINFFDVDNPFIATALASHNTYLQLLSETGLVGFAAFFYLVVRSWREARSRLRSSSDFLDMALAFGVLGAILSVLVQGLVDFLFQANPQFGTLFWVLLGFLVVSSQLPRQADSAVIG